MNLRRAALREDRAALRREAGEMTLVKIRTDIPLPIPRCVMSSPIHMISAVPAVSDQDDERHARRR